MRKAFGILLAITLIAMFGFLGCKNTCQKAAGHAIDCIKAYCGDHQDNSRCADEMLTAFEATMEAMASQCNEEMSQESEELLGRSCEEVLVELGFEAPSE